MSARIPTGYRDTGAWDKLEEWLGAKPGRYVKRMVKGRDDAAPSYWVTLQGRKDYTSTTQLTLESAVRTALAIAFAEGDR